MAIKIGRYSFEGPYFSTASLEDRSGIYAILCQDYRDDLIDVGESSNVKTRVETHDRTKCWERNCSGNLAYAVLYTPNQQQEGRLQIEQDIRNQYDLPCGDR